STDRHARRLAGFVPLPLFLVGLAAFTTAPPNSVRLASPDGQVSIIVRTAAHVTELEISYRGAPVIERSNLAFTLDGVDITQGARIQRTENYKVDDSYPTRGVHSRAVNRCNGDRIALIHPASRTEYT